MNKKPVFDYIDFADSEYLSFHISEDATLTIYLKSWDAKFLNLIFNHVVQFSYKLGSDPSNLFEKKNSHELEKILLEIYGIVPADNTFKLFILEDIDDFPFIQVVAESVSVVKY